jgi:hypothetical protein
MNRILRLGQVIGCATIVTVAGCAAGGSGVGVPAAGGSTASGNAVASVPQYVLPRSASRALVQPATASIGYNGGPVLEKPRLYLIFWGWGSGGDPDGVKSLLLHYAKSVGGSGYNNIYTQYYGPKGHIKNPADQFGGEWLDETNKLPAEPTDAQIAGEAVRYVTKFGYDANGAYVVATPHNHNTKGFGTEFCGYHNATTYRHKTVAYLDLSYIPDAGDDCGANIISPPPDESAADEGVTIILGAMYGDTVTDPAPPTGWALGGEISKFCAWLNIQNDPYGSHSYTAQPMFSNASGSCVHSYHK